MKRKPGSLTILLFSLIVLLFLLCILLCVMVTRFSKMRMELMQAERENTRLQTMENETEAGAESTAEHKKLLDMFRTTEETEEAATFSIGVEEPQPFSGHILIGDSRTVMLERAVDYAPTDRFICKGAMAYDWFLAEAVPELRSILDTDPDYAVVILMGINDCANNCAGWTEYFVSDYVETINELCMDYPTTKFYFASVGHIKNYYMATRGPLMEDEMNAYVDIFNSYMEANCLCYYIDVCEHLDEVGYVWADNVHYANATSQEIYDYIVKKVNANTPDL